MGLDAVVASLHDLGAAASLYGRLVAAQVRSQLQYRTSFALHVLSQTSSSGDSDASTMGG